MRVCTRKAMCVHVRVQMRVQVKCQYQVSSSVSHFPLFFLRQCLSSNLELTNLASHRAPGVFLLGSKITSFFFFLRNVSIRDANSGLHIYGASAAPTESSPTVLILACLYKAAVNVWPQEASLLPITWMGHPWGFDRNLHRTQIPSKPLSRPHLA